MAYIEISNLPETLNLNDESVFPVVYQGETRKVKFNSMAKIFNYFTSISYNKTTGVYTFTRVDGTSALLSTDLQKSFKDVSLSNGIITFTAHSGETKTIDISIPDNSITFAKLAVALQTRIDSKYSKPGSGIPKADLSNEVQASLEKAETAIQDVSGKEDKSNKTGILDENSTDTQYPHAKAVYDNFVTRDEEIEKLQTENAQLLADHPDILDENDEFPSGTDLTLNGTGDLKMKVDVGGNSTQETTTGANLQKFSSRENSSYNYKCDEKGQVTVTGNISSFVALGYNLQSSNPMTLSAGTYKIKVIGTKSSNTSILINGTTGITLDENQEYVLVLAEATSTFYIALGINTGTHNDDFYITLASGTTATTERYTGGTASPNPTYKQDINNVEGDVVVKGSSKNRLAYPEDFIQTKNNITVIGSKGIYKINGTSSANTTFNIREIQNYTIQEGDYVHLLNDKINNNFAFVLKFTDDSFASISLGYLKRIFDLSSFVGKTISGIYFYTNSGYTSDNITFSPMILNINTATPFVPFAENTVTFPLSQGQKLMLGDTLEDDGVHHKKLQLVFDGTENWRQTTTLDNYIAYNLTLEKNAIKNGSNDTSTNEALCTIAKYNWYYNYLQENQFTLNNDTLRIVTDKVSTVEEFKSYLAQQYANNTPIIVEYELETETIDPYTPEQQTAYNKLKEMQSYYDLTYVTGLSDNAQPILTAHAKKSIKELSGGDLSNYQTNNNYIQWKPYKNIFNKDSTDNVNGFYINQANGYKNVNTNFSAYILKIEGGKTISVSGGGGVQIGFATEYTNLSTLNTNTQVNGWISGGFSGNNISVPLNAKYLFVSSVTNSFGDLQVEYNKYSTKYTPYKLVVPNTRELQEQIDVLDLSLENKIDYVKSKNIFNKNSTDKADGFWINNTNGHAYKNINSALSIVMLPIIGGKTISIKGCSNVSQYAFCSEYTDIVSLQTNYILKGYISGSNFNATKLEGLVVPDNAKYMAISTTTSFMNNVQIEYNERCTSFEPYGNSIPTNEHIVKVGIGEDYQTLKEGIEYATQFQNSIVKVKKGTYDLVEEFEDELETSVGLILKNNVHIIFEVGTKVKFNYNGNSEHVHTSFSPFNSGVNGFVIENLDLEASNCRYCIHDERGNSTDFYHNVYKNCRMKLDNSQNPDWVNPQNIGAGLANGVIEIENCRFNNWISFHNNNGTQTNSKSNVYIKDSYFESGSVILGSYGNTTEISNFYISGNFMNSNIINQDTSSTPLINVELHAWNNVIE